MRTRRSLVLRSLVVGAVAVILLVGAAYASQAFHPFDQTVLPGGADPSTGQVEDEQGDANESEDAADQSAEPEASPEAEDTDETGDDVEDEAEADESPEAEASPDEQSGADDESDNEASSPDAGDDD